MIVEPYKRTPVAPRIAILTPELQAVDEGGELLDLDDWPETHRLWASYETVYTAVRDGKGEALCWNHEEIRWRHRRFEEDWKRRPSDASVVKLPFEQLPLQLVLTGFAAWRDWLAGFGASPQGTSGAAAWSLLRATLERELWTGSGERPPLDRTVGGRQQLGPAGRGRFEGPLVLLDLPAAYASTLGGLRYGGQWLRYRDPSAVSVQLERYAGSDYPVFVRAKVRVPKGLLGPLVQRQKRKPRSFLEAMLLGQTYPTGRVVQGTWTWEELEAARLAGCTVVKVFECWVHRSGHYPFRPWWEAVQQGRRMPGLAGQLAKITGNALWGRFCMDASVGVRTIRSKNGTLVARGLPGGSQLWPAHDLAETVSGRVRAKLFTLMEEVGDGLVSAHTDGAWIRESEAQASDQEAEGADRSSQSHPGLVRGGLADVSLSRDCRATPRTTVGKPERDFEARHGSCWRTSQYARRLDLIDPQTLRYWPDPAQPWEPAVVYAGVPAERAGEAFETRWQREMQ